MHYVVKRLGFRITRGWFALILIVSALAIAAFWVGPFRPLPAQLQLLALSADGRFHDAVAIPNDWADSLPAASEATARFPLILAVHNAGAVAARPTRLSINLPARYRLTNKHGQPLRVHMTRGNPLVRYDLPVRTNTIEPGRQPAMLPGLDTLYLEAVVPNIYCTALADSVPEFVSAPPQDPRLLARVQAFYSFTGPRIHQRQAGLLTVQVDPELVRRDPAPAPRVYETEVVRPQAPRPEMHGLHFVGSRSSWCGDPGQPVEIRDALYETADAGRLFVLYRGRLAQKYLFDLNRDSLIELEMWDADGDGKMESRRATDYAIPSFLMPYHEASDSLAADTLSDTTALRIDTVQTTPEWLNTFYDTTAGPLRFAPRDTSHAQAPAPSATSTPPTTPAPAAAEPPAIPASATRVDTAWLRVFNETAAGPLRFYRAQHGMPAAPAPKPAPPKPTGPGLLGVPVDTVARRAPARETTTTAPVRRPRRDTARTLRPSDTARIDTLRRDTLRPDTFRIR